jgi:tetratricopeptide (TPR) repeat protein
MLGISMLHRRALLAFVCVLGVAAAQSSASQASIAELHDQAAESERRGDLAGAARRYEEILRLDPTIAAAYNNLGAIYFKEREFDKAAVILEKGLRVDARMASATALLGMSLYESGKYAEARPKLEAAYNANRADANVEMFLANDLTKLGDFEAAAIHLQRLADRQPNNQHVWYLLARVYMQLGRQALTKMNSIDPNSVWAHEISGEILEGMKNYDAAIVEYKKAVEAGPREPGAHYKLGDAYWSLSQWDNATPEFKAELANDPNNCMAQWKLGDILIRQNARPEEALGDVEKSLAMCPNLTEARVDRGKLLIQLHRNEEALRDLQTAEKATPDDSQVHFLLARAYRALGRGADAQSEMQIFSKLEESARAATAEKAQEVIGAEKKGN